jgi:hypothetical protein
MESLVSGIPAGGRKTANLFLQCTVCFIWLQNTEPALCMSYQTTPAPHYMGSPPPRCVASLPFTIWKRTLVWLNHHYLFKKSEGGTEVEEPTHVKQVSLNPE